MPRRQGGATFARGLGERIRALRVEAGVTQEDLAWSVDLNKGYLSQVESGKRTPTLSVLVQLAHELNVEVVDLVGYDLDQPQAALLDAVRRKDRKGLKKALRVLGLG